MAGRNITIRIDGEGESAKRALEMVQEELQKTSAESEQAAIAMSRVGNSLEHGVPQMAAASAGLRALEGNFTNNIRAGERFITMLPGMANLLQAAFPYVGAVVLGTALFEMGEKAYHAFQNVVLLKGALESLDALDITVGKKVQSASDAAEASLESSLQATQGRAAALRQKYSYESNKPIDLSDLFYDKNFSGLQSNIKADYENLYKSVAPQDLPNRLAKIRSEISELNGALATVKSGTMGAFVPYVGGQGPGTLEDPEKYYEARIKAATDVQKLLTAEASKRSASLQAIQNEAAKSDTSKGASANSMAEARAKLEDEQAKLALAKRKAANQIMQAEDDAQHKMDLDNEQDYLAEKLRRQIDELDAEEEALNSRGATLQSLYEKQHADPKLKRGADGTSAEEVKTQTELLRIEEQRQEISVRRAQVTSAGGAEASSANITAELASLRVAAELEKERNQSITARQTLLAYETDQAVKKSNAGGGSEADTLAIRQAGDLQDQKLQIEQVDQRIMDTQKDYARLIDEVNDKVSKGDTSKVAGAKQIQQLNKDEAAALKQLVDQYSALAEMLGGPYKQNAADLQEQLKKLGRPDTSQDFTHKLSSDLESMTDSIAESAARGKQSFGELAKSVLDDIDRMALKMVEAKFMAPLFEGMAHSGTGGGTGAPAGSDGGLGGLLGGTAAGLAPKLWKPPTPSNAGGGAGSAIAGIAQTAAKALTPNISHNIINQSSNPVSADEPQVNYDSEMQQWVIDTILHDHETGGPVSQLWNSNSGG